MPILEMVMLAIRVVFKGEVDVHILDWSSSCDQGNPNPLDDANIPLVEQFQKRLRTVNLMNLARFDLIATVTVALNNSRMVCEDICPNL
jgi:hypothetical protein